MPAIFSKNCILTGTIDFYCLLCNLYLKSENDVLLHIQGSIHKNRSSLYDYLDKYKKDYIKKINGVYFCEACNISFSTSTKVDFHTKEESHMTRKNSLQLKRAGDYIVVDGNIKVSISETSWHGLVDNTCVLCNMEYDNQSAHKAEKKHIFNLINSNVTIRDNDVYRKVDDLYQCLTCNKVMSEESLSNHLQSDEHKKALNVDKTQDMHNSNSNEGKVTSDKSGPSTLKNANKGTFSKPTQVKENEIVPAFISKKIEALVKKHGLIIKNDTIVFCNVCDKQLLGTANSIEEHIESKIHKTKKRSNAGAKNPNDIEKTLIRKFIKTVSKHVDCNPSSDYNDYEVELDESLILNESLFLNIFTFLGISKFGNKIICRFCNMDMNREHLDDHIKTPPHFDFVDKCFVITSLDNEFVREIKIDLYDCAFCGHTESDFDDMLDHLASSEHKKCKDKQQDKLIKYRIGLAQEREHYSTLYHLLMMQHMFRF